MAATTSHSALQFPCRFPLKAIGTGPDDFVAIVARIVRKHAPDLAAEAVTSRFSSGGKYVSVTATFTARSREQLDAIYLELSGHERVVTVL